MMAWLRQSRIKTQLWAVTGIVCAVLCMLSFNAWKTAHLLIENARFMAQGKDLVADILPPPLYLIEAQLLVFRLQDAKPEERQELWDKLRSLKQEYDTRNTYWTNSDLRPALKTLLLEKQKATSEQFWEAAFDPQIPRLFEQLETAHAYSMDPYPRSQAAIRQWADSMYQLYLVHRTAVDATVVGGNGFANEMIARMDEDGQRSVQHSLWMMAWGLFIVGAVLAAIARLTLQRLGAEPAILQVVAERIAQGDLREKVEVAERARSSLLGAVAVMQDNLQSTLSGSRVAAEQVHHAVSQLVHNAKQVAHSSSQQSDATSSMAAAVEEMTVSIGHVAESANGTKQLAQETETLSTEGRVFVQDTIAEINKIVESVNRSGADIQSLGEQSSKISSIVNVIKEIADQTNLLALNAAIEAARAGEQGRGFAVVADEVRQLAERTTKSTQEIGNMISMIIHGTQDAVLSMKQCNSQLIQGVDMAAKAGEAMSKIERGTQRVLGSVEDISSALREQSTASEQVAVNLEKNAQMTEKNCVAIGAVSEAADQLEKLSATLKQSVERFQLPPSPQA